ncbi:MAG: radical SAM protein [Acidobacteriota bacterium]
MPSASPFEIGLSPEPAGLFVIPARRPDDQDFVNHAIAPPARPLQPSMFNLRVPLPERDEVFLMNTLTDAQLVVSPDVAALIDRVVGPDGRPADLRTAFTTDEIDALQVLIGNGFLVPDRAADRRELDKFFHRVTSNTEELNITVLTTLQCNFACDYCYQGDRGDYNKFAAKMSMATAVRVGDWIERELGRVNPERFTLMFFGGEPLLNLPVMYYLAERLWHASRARGVLMNVTIITNGLLLTPEVVDHLEPFGLRGIKITLDGDRDTHNRMRPLRGGQGTFDRIVENIRQVADRVRVAIGGNFDESSVESYPALLKFLSEQDFAGKLVKVNFKPVIRTKEPLKNVLTLTPVNADGKPLGGTCMTAVGEGKLKLGGTACDSCGFGEAEMAFLREETRRSGFPTPDGVHNGPCHVHMQHAHTIGPDGSLYACPGFTGDLGLSTGHVDDRRDAVREEMRGRFDRLDPWMDCGDCAFIPVCAGGCLVASHTQLGDMNAPTCFKRSFESAVIALAHDVAGAAEHSVAQAA